MVRPSVVLCVCLLASSATAQFSGGSFGGSGDFGGGSSSSSSSSSGSSSWGGSSSHDSFAEQRRRDEEARRREEDRRRAEEERRRAEEEARRRAEEEARRRAYEEQLRREAEARQLATDRALPPRERAALSTRFVDTPLDIPAPTPASARHFVPPIAGRPAMLAVPDTGSAPPGELRASWLWGLGCGLFGFLSIALPGLAFRRLAERIRARPKPVRASARPAFARRSSTRAGSCELRRISIAFDASERRAIQAELAAMARHFDPSAPGALHRAAERVVQLLTPRLVAARYAVWSSAFVHPRDAKGRLHTILSDLKSRYRHDVTRGDQGPSGARARAEEGEGLVVVSVVIGTTKWLGRLPGQLGPNELARALRDAVSGSPRDFVALEVIWSPALEQDRMSSLELETVYPELVRLNVGSPLGRLQCSYCGAVHAAELPRCPACGAPRPS